MSNRIRSRFLGVLWLGIVWPGLLMLLWVMPFEHRSPAGELRRTGYGLFRWQVGRPDGEGEISTPMTALTAIVTAMLTAWALFALVRIMQNTRPRSQCNACGHDITTSEVPSNTCSRCGRLPNAQRNPWAFWR
ncbi:MAG: hypothetical protein AAF432_00240 [Planctomycetota bacterium]